MPDEDVLRRLRAAVASMDAFAVSDLVDAAREDAIAEARSLIQAMMTKELLERAVEHLGQGRGGEAVTAPPAPGQQGEQLTGSASKGHRSWAWYVYGVQEARAPVPAAEGVGGNAVRAVIAGGLQALTSRVPAEDFDEEALAEKISDLDWLSKQAQAHEAVLSAALEVGSVLPLRFGTVFSSRERVEELLGEHAAALEEQLRRLEGHGEWSVKVLADQDLLGRWVSEHDPAVGGAGSDEHSSEGRAYFTRKRREAALEEARQRAADEVARACHERLATVAAAATTAPPQDPALSGYTQPMVLNGIYLVGEDDLDGFRRTVAELREMHEPRGFEVVLTGPWPAHHFVDLPAGGVGASAGGRAAQ